MPNIASVLKEEIARLARKEIRAETERLKKASGVYRAEIAQLKRRLQNAERQLVKLSRGGKRAPVADASAAVEDETPHLRFSAKGLKSQRERLGLSAADVAAIIGVSGQSIYKWEEGATRPRASQLPAIAILRGMGKKEARKRLEALRAE